MDNSIKIILSFVLLVGLPILAIYPGQLVLVGPRLTIPTIKTPGESIDVIVRHSIPIELGDWKLTLQGQAGQEYPLTVSDTQSGLGKSVVVAKLPGLIPVGSYTLVVGNRGRHTFQKNAVHVVKQYSADLTIVQLADLPTFGGDESGDKRFQSVVREINIINPDVVLFTGDLAYGGSWDQYHRLLAMLEDLHAPIIAAPGNHEYYGWAGYLTLLGRPYHSVRFGQFEFLSLNSGHGRDQLTQTQLGWFEKEMLSSDAKQFVLQLHHPIHHRDDLSGFIRGNVLPLKELIKAKSVDIVLSGHWHGDSVYDEQGVDRTDTWQFAGTPFVVTTTAGGDLRPAYSSSPLHYGYRLIRFINNELESYTYDYDGDGERDAVSSIPMGNLSVEANGEYGVIVKNKLNEGFINARVSITLPDSKHDYIPNIGTIYSVSKDENTSTYQVLVDLPANRDTNINMVMQGDTQ